MSKKLGPLQRGIVVGGVKRGLIGQAMAAARRTIELQEKFKLLFAKYGVAEGNWKHLAVCLAMTYEPGLKPIDPPGPAVGKGWLWTPECDDKLVRGIALLREKNAKVSTRKACSILSTTADFKGSSAEGLRRRYGTLSKSILGG